MNRNIALRFRDLVEETIPEHRKRIDEFGYVWWGWWNKPDEKIPRAVFEDFQEKINADGFLWIFLTDSGTLRLYKAKMIEVCMAGDDEPIECKEIEKVPEYYFTSNYKVWFRFSKILDTTSDEIREWSYIFDDDVKDDDEIKRYNNKRIESVQEMLNCTHRTIYHIQPYDPENHKDKLCSDEDGIHLALDNKAVVKKFVSKILEIIEKTNKYCHYAPKKTVSPIAMPPYPIDMEKKLSILADSESRLRDFSSHIYQLIVDGHNKALADHSVIRKSDFLRISNTIVYDIRLFRCDYHHLDISDKDKARLGKLYWDVCGKNVLDDAESKVNFQIDLLRRVEELLEAEFELVKIEIMKAN